MLYIKYNDFITKLPTPFGSVFYLFGIFVFRIFEFLRRWYVVVGFFLIKKVFEIIKNIEEKLKFFTTIIYFFDSLRTNKSIDKKIFEFIFCSGKIFFAFSIYIFIIFLVTVIYILWALFPLFVISKIIMP